MQWAKTEKVRKLRTAMELLLQGRPPQHVKNMLNLTYQDLLKVGLIARQQFKDRAGKITGYGAYVCALEPDLDAKLAMEAFDEVVKDAQ